MLLDAGGVDVWYIDESTDPKFMSASAIAIPLLRKGETGWRWEWEDYLDRVKQFRRSLSKTHKIPAKKELHAVKLASGRGRYRGGRQQFGRGASARVYRSILSALHFLPPMSVITVIGSPQSQLYGHTKLEALMYALFQRMQRASSHHNRNGMVFFDEGHGEYRKLYRKARKFLPTGSQQGSWDSGPTRNIPMDKFVKDANFKDSKHSPFIQIADLIAYAAFLKAKQENSALSPWQVKHQLGSLYDAIPQKVLNTRASARDPQGIVRI